MVDHTGTVTGVALVSPVMNMWHLLLPYHLIGWCSGDPQCSCEYVMSGVPLLLYGSSSLLVLFLTGTSLVFIPIHWLGVNGSPRW